LKKLKEYTLLLVLVVFLTNFNKIISQNKFIDKNGTLTFEASEKVFEDVKAINKTTAAIFDESSGEIAAIALIKEFKFKNALMEEHFNENYIESYRHPRATFKGVLLDFDISRLTFKKKKFKLKGTLALRGKERQLETFLTIKKINSTIFIAGNFVVSPEDFSIEIPKIIRNKIAKNVSVSLNFKLNKK